MAGELKRFSGNPSFTSDTVFETDIIPFTHNPGGSEDGDGKISFSEMRKFTTGEVSKKIEKWGFPYYSTGGTKLKNIPFGYNDYEERQ